jgi:hypothetical protein
VIQSILGFVGLKFDGSCVIFGLLGIVLLDLYFPQLPQRKKPPRYILLGICFILSFE